MKRIKIIFILTVMILSVLNVEAQSEGKEVSITASGTGKTFEDAKNSALSSILELAFDTYISAKTEINNDKYLSDQILSISAGTINSYKILSQNILSDSISEVTLTGTVSLYKLQKIVEARGISVEANGSEFAFQLKQDILREKEELKAVSEMIGQLHEIMQISSDYSITSSEPISLDESNQNWQVQINLKVSANKNIEHCSSYFKKVMETFSMSSSDLEKYESSNRKTYEVKYQDGNSAEIYHFRQEATIRIIQTFTNEWFGFLSSFNLQIGNKFDTGSDLLQSLVGSLEFEDGRIKFRNYTESGRHKDCGWAFNFYGDKYIDFTRISHSIYGQYIKEVFATINFPTSGQTVMELSLEKKFSLNEISSISSIIVKPRGITSKFKNGGIVISEKNGIGIAISLLEIGYKNWTDSKNICESLAINGFSDWRIPSKDELLTMSTFYKNGFGFGGFHDGQFWSSTLIKNNYHRYPVYYRVSMNGDISDFFEMDNFQNMFARPVRTYSYTIKKNPAIISVGDTRQSSTITREAIDLIDTTKILRLTTTGSGKSKDESINSALRIALQQSFGAYYSTKTEIFNDSILGSQIVSVGTGNIKSFDIVYQSQLPDKSWVSTLNTIVYIDKLSRFLESKGVKISVNGGLFSRNIILQNSNEVAEVEAISQTLGVIHEILQTSFDFDIRNGTPIRSNSENIPWTIPLVINVRANKNIDLCADYLLKTISALSLSEQEIENYQSLKKKVFKLLISYKGSTNLFHLRKRQSIIAIKTIFENWEFYLRLFTVKSGVDQINGKGEAHFDQIINSEISAGTVDAVNLSILSDGNLAGVLTYNDNKTLSEIEKITGYQVVPRGIISNYKNGGYVVYEKNGHGLVLAPYDLGKFENLKAAAEFCNLFAQSGYSDWRLPTKIEMDILRDVFFTRKLAGIVSGKYWISANLSDKSASSSTLYYLANNKDEEFSISWRDSPDDFKLRAVRNF
jgi:hypothetical protein